MTKDTLIRYGYRRNKRDYAGHGDRHLTQVWVNVPVPMTNVWAHESLTTD